MATGHLVTEFVIGEWAHHGDRGALVPTSSIKFIRDDPSDLE